MSNYYKLTRHPVTDEWEKALWIDDCFGSHEYGVQFSDGNIYNPEEMELETREDVELEKKDVWGDLNKIWLLSMSGDTKNFRILSDFIKTHFIPRAEVVEKVKGMRKTPLEGMLATDIQIGHGYNAALDDLLDLLTQK